MTMSKDQRIEYLERRLQEVTTQRDWEAAQHAKALTDKARAERQHFAKLRAVQKSHSAVFKAYREKRDAELKNAQLVVDLMKEEIAALKKTAKVKPTEFTDLAFSKGPTVNGVGPVNMGVPLKHVTDWGK